MSSPEQADESGERFTDAQLERIVDEATLYMCACPAQVAVAIRQLRYLIDFQENCLTQEGAETAVHERIAKAGIAAQAIMEACMDDVLTLERWDRATLKMPEGLRQRRMEMIKKM